MKIVACPLEKHFLFHPFSCLLSLLPHMLWHLARRSHNYCSASSFFHILSLSSKKLLFPGTAPTRNETNPLLSFVVHTASIRLIYTLCHNYFKIVVMNHGYFRHFAFLSSNLYLKKKKYSGEKKKSNHISNFSR